MLVALEPWDTLGYSADGLVEYLTRDDPGPTPLPHSRRHTNVWRRLPSLPVAARTLHRADRVRPRRQGQGLGGQVLNWIEDEVRGDATNLWALVSSFNELARRFYE